MRTPNHGQGGQATPPGRNTTGAWTQAAGRQHQAEVTQHTARGERTNSGDQDSGPPCDGAPFSATGCLPVRKWVDIGAIFPPLDDL